jgi:hypothetical protein
MAGFIVGFQVEDMSEATYATHTNQIDPGQE